MHDTLSRSLGPRLRPPGHKSGTGFYVALPIAPGGGWRPGGVLSDREGLASNCELRFSVPTTQMAPLLQRAVRSPTAGRVSSVAKPSGELQPVLVVGMVAVAGLARPPYWSRRTAKAISSRSKSARTSPPSCSSPNQARSSCS